jgi:hypothetical protein
MSKLAMLLLLLALVHATQGAAAQYMPELDDGAGQLDLAALLLRPSDLEAAGLDGYGAAEGQTFTTIEEAVTAMPYADSRGSIAFANFSSAADLLRETGWQRFHERMLATSDEDDPARYGAAVYSGIEEYADADGAAIAYAQFTEERALRALMNGTPEPVDDAPSLGDASGMWVFRGEATDSGEPYIELTIWTLVDNFIVSVDITDFLGTEQPDPALIEQLMERLLGRIADADTMEASGLSNRMVRLTGWQVSPVLDGYGVLDSDIVPLWGESAADMQARQDEADEFGIIDTYILRQRLSPSSLAQDDRLFYQVYASTFGDRAGARAYMDDFGQGLQNDESVSDLEISEVDTDLGNEAIAYTYSLAGDNRTQLAVRNGAHVTLMQIRFAKEPLVDVVTELVEQQMRCVEDKNACREPMVAPEELAIHGVWHIGAIRSTLSVRGNG